VPWLHARRRMIYPLLVQDEPDGQYAIAPQGCVDGILMEARVGSDSLNQSLDAAPALVAALDRCLQPLAITTTFGPGEVQHAPTSHALARGRQRVGLRRLLAGAALVAILLVITYAVVSLLSAQQAF
jgi:hypothetical protein